MNSSLRGAYQAMCKRFDGGADAMAAALGLTASALQNRIYEVKGQSVTIEHALAMQSLTGTTLFAEAIAVRSGGSFFAHPEIGELDKDELLAKFQQLLDAFGRLSRRHSEAIEDGEVDARERSDLLRLADEMHRCIQELLALTFRIYCKDEAAGAHALRSVADVAGGRAGGRESAA
ncbi:MULTISPECIES: YmfL family putative regulatory protein [unclassified Paraburkholderia]|uniref:YmfL family putative regulatory protein n=1 Tax=unclassified Paraburkholderia TaxID=2615204 RepID=UPI002AAF7662|nr:MULTISPECIES: YmfL family putative regulatory protein [unclassified Paraburkholderia]